MKIYTNKLHKHQVEFKVELQNRFNVLGAIPCNDLDATADTITKVIHEPAILVAGRHQDKKQASYQPGQKCYGKREEWWREAVPPGTTLNTFKHVRPSGREWRVTSWLLMRNKFLKPSRKTRAWSMPDASCALANMSSYPSWKKMALGSTTRTA